MTAALSSIPVIALSSVPGTNVFAGFIKFFVYWNKQDELKHDLINGAANATGSMSVDETGKKVSVVAKETLEQIDSDVSNLKWFSLFQMIPLIGIIGVIFEQRILNNFKPNTSDPSVEENTQPNKPLNKIKNLTNEDFINGGIAQVHEGRQMNIENIVREYLNYFT